MYEHLLNKVADPHDLESSMETNLMTATPTNSQIVHDDQRENARREAEERRIASLRLDQRDTAIEAEVLRRQEYERTSRLSSGFPVTLDS
jgi:hypothetical protein